MIGGLSRGRIEAPRLDTFEAHAMNTVLLILHFLGLGAGFAASIGNNLVIMLVAKAPPDEAAGLRRFPMAMLPISDIGLVFLWITGIIMLWTKYGGVDGFGALPWSFWAKIVCVVLLTGMIGMVHMAVGRMKRGDMSVAGRLPVYGRIGAVLLLLIVVFAVMAFD
jgi:hypothetical protein